MQWDDTAQGSELSSAQHLSQASNNTLYKATEEGTSA